MQKALLTDLYELTMAYSYFKRGMNTPAVFDLFVRPPVPGRRFLVFAGLDSVLDYLENFAFGDEDLAYLESLGLFDDAFLRFLADLRFSGDVWAMPEGTIVYPGEPLITVEAPRIEAQLVETYLLNVVNFETLIASKAARVLRAAGEDKGVVDFSPRRDHGEDAAMRVARASYLAGMDGTSNTLAGKRFGIPVVGTMAHAYVMSFSNELAAFRAFAEDHPRPILLIDTYDVFAGLENAITVARELEARGRRLVGVRIDSGDLARLTPEVRRRLDAAGLGYVKILISGDLDEYKIRDFYLRGGVADSFGVGTRLGTSYDLPALGGVYKLVEDVGGPKIKKSPGKVTLPGKKQVFLSKDGLTHVIGLRTEVGLGEPLLAPVMEGGRRRLAPADLARLRQATRARIFALPPWMAGIDAEPAPAYPVRLSDRLAELLRRALDD